jgi:hypothetical protein
MAVGMIAASALLVGAARADDEGVSVQSGQGGLLVAIGSEAANVHFDYALHGCKQNIPCLVVWAGIGLAGVPMSAGGGCHVSRNSDSTPGAIECPAAGVGAITFRFKKGGSWSAYQGGGGQHAGGVCSPAAVTVETGPDGSAVQVNAWNGCPEAIVCNSPPSVFTAVEADASDEIRGTCKSVILH